MIENNHLLPGGKVVPQSSNHAPLLLRPVNTGEEIRNADVYLTHFLVKLHYLFDWLRFAVIKPGEYLVKGRDPCLKAFLDLRVELSLLRLPKCSTIELRLVFVPQG